MSVLTRLIANVKGHKTLAERLVHLLTRRVVFWIAALLLGAGSLLVGIWLYEPRVAFIVFGIMVLTLVVGEAYGPAKPSNS